jgi:hypothetical protein
MGTSKTELQSPMYRGPVRDLLKLLARKLLDRWAESARGRRLENGAHDTK